MVHFGLTAWAVINTGSWNAKKKQLINCNLIKWLQRQRADKFISHGQQMICLEVVSRSRNRGCFSCLGLVRQHTPGSNSSKFLSTCREHCVKNHVKSVKPEHGALLTTSTAKNKKQRNATWFSHCYRRAELPKVMHFL